jgi:hypothetical protein
MRHATRSKILRSRGELQGAFGSHREIFRLLDCDTGLPQFAPSLMAASGPIASLPGEKNESND